MNDFERQIAEFSTQWHDATPTLVLHTSGSTGRPKPIRVSKSAMRASAVRTCQALSLPRGITSLLCMPMAYVAGRMVCVRAWEWDMRLIVVPPSLHPFATLDEVPYFAAMTPMQVYETLRVPDEAARLMQVSVLLIGGGALSPSITTALAHHPGAYSTYGMTETLSHIALRHVSQNTYRPLAGVTLQRDDRGCLIVSDTHTGVANLVTNDLVDIQADGRFRILGRADNTICSGALKWQIEDLETRLSDLPVPIQVTAVPDTRLGEAIVLLYVSASDTADDASLLLEACRLRLPRHALPRHLVPVAELPQTPTGKPDRPRARTIARAYLS